MSNPTKFGTNDLPELMPCPFCGSGNVHMSDNGQSSYVYCPECETEGPPDATPSAATDTWNRRAQPEGDRTPAADAGSLDAFESTVRADPDRGVMTEHFLRKLASRDPANPEFLDRMVDHDWQTFRNGWIAARTATSAAVQPEGEAPQADCVDCPKCAGSSVVGEKRGIRCTYCEGRGYLFQAAQHAESGAQAALRKINDIRNSIIGLQSLNWSEHVYPLVAALDEAGLEGMGYPEARKNYGTLLERAVKAEDQLAALAAQSQGASPGGETNG